jgi:hypothetical protein
MNKIHTIGIINFRPNVEPLEITFNYPEEKGEYVFKLHYDNSMYDRFLSEEKGNILLETSSYVELEEYTEKIPKRKALDKSIFLNHIEKINYAIDLIRYSYKDGKFTSMFRIRNIGEQDFLFHKLIVNNKHESSSLAASYGDKTASHVEIEKLSESVPFEWRTFTRVKDLLYLGFFNESLIIAFNLLDYCIQKTIKSLMTNLTDSEKEYLLRQIKEQRLKTYLGPLFKTLTGNSFYDNKITEKNLNKLNSKRNKIVHDGQNCTYEEVCESLKTIFYVIQGLNDKGNQKFEIPIEIIFINI